MAKRYHQSKKDRMHEKMGMEQMRSHEVAMHRDKMSHFDEPYAGMEPRRRHELEDAGMIHEDHSAIANMPQNVMIKPYRKSGAYMPEGLDDTIRGIDEQMNSDDRKRSATFNPHKY